MKPTLISFDWLYRRQLLSFYFFLLQCENNIIKYCFPLVYSASLIVGLTIWRVFAGCFLVSATLHQCLWSNWKWHISNDMERDMKMNAQDSGCVLEYFFSIPSFFSCVFFFKCMILVVYIFVNDNSQEILSSPNIILLTCEVLISQLWWAHTLGVHFCLPFRSSLEIKQIQNISTSNKNCLLLNTLS